VAVAATLIASAQASVSFELCSDSLNDFGIEDVVLPEFAVAGEKFAVELIQKPNKAIGKGHVRVEVDVEGVKVAHDWFELCEVTDCHLQAHTPSKTLLWMSLPAAMPAGFETSIKVLVNDHNGAQLSCVEVHGINVEKPSSKSSSNMLRASAEGDSMLSLAREELEFLFDKWAREYGMKFSTAEVFKHMRTFADNLETIALHNKGGHSYKLGLNEFAHLSNEEFAQTHFGFNGKIPNAQVNREYYQMDSSSLGLSDIPDEVDWVKKGAVTPVKNQGSCGSCWSFSTTGALEGAYYLKTGKLVSFSEEELVNCDKVDQGCNGGLMDNAFQWIMQNGGLCSEDDYPYTSGSGLLPHRCKSSCDIVDGSAPTSFVDVQHSEMSLEEAVAQQPVAIAIEADQLAFQFYRKGVLVGNCGSRLDHGVLAVGYGTYSDGNKYWKVKNSWGGSWGMNGYILIQRGKQVRGGECGLLLSASYPVL